MQKITRKTLKDLTIIKYKKVKRIIKSVETVACLPHSRFFY